MSPFNPHPSLPAPFPACWASAWGQDKSGLWMALSLDGQGIRQVFRWIAPGTFLMGSPDSERDRDNDELQHEVTLSHGYWLADTACTQAFWQAVMGDNPARFNDSPDNPVENVSWEDVQVFIAKLNERIPNLDARLPSEAEWEYACRAGTVTPFSFGDNITPEQVNYDGEFPYADGAEGEYRRQTVPVKSLPPNAWGLYEMHGNVWEWCQDWYGDYQGTAVTDPPGPASGTERVLRGGSWNDLGRFVRSAIRNWSTPDNRNDRFGLRLALGQTAGQGGVAHASGTDRQAERSQSVARA